MAEMESLRERDRIMKSIANFDRNAKFLPPIMPNVNELLSSQSDFSALSKSKIFGKRKANSVRP